MNKKLIFAFIGILLMIFVFGCGEDKVEEQVASTTNPSEVISSTTATEKPTTEKATEEMTKRSLLDKLYNYLDTGTSKSQLEIANETIDNIVDAIKKKDKKLLKSVFSENAQNKADNFDKNAEKLLSMIKGDIVSYLNVGEFDIGESKEVSYGDVHKVITYSFTFETQKDKYHVAISQCIIDDSDEKNTGIESLYIIEDKHWAGGSVFRGLQEEEDKRGIIIVNEQDLKRVKKEFYGEEDEIVLEELS